MSIRAAYALACAGVLSLAGCTQTKDLLEKANDSMTRAAERLSQAVGAGAPAAATAQDAAQQTDPTSRSAPGTAADTPADKPAAADASGTRKGQTVLAGLTPGPYQPSKFAIGADAEAMHYRAETPGDGLVPAPILTNYLNDLYARVKAATGITGIPGRVYLRPEASYIGLATPDGNLFLSLNQVRDIQCEDQLVALIAHELGHVVLQHHNSDSVRMLTQQVPGGQATIERALESLPNRLPGAMNILPRGLPGGLPGAPAGLPGSASGARNPLAAARSMGVEVSVLDDLLFPAWSRSHESDADRFALDVSRRMGYSFATGVKEWLEQVEDVEEQQKATGQVATSTKRTRRGAPGVQIPGFDVNGWAQERLKHTRRTHASNRVEALFDYFELHYGDEDAPEQKCGAFPKLKATREVQQLFEAYDLAFEIDGLLRTRARSNPRREALTPEDRATLAALAQKLEKHPFRLDAHPMILNRLYRAHVLTESRSAPAILDRTRRSPELAWVTFRTQADVAAFQPNGRAEAAKVLMDGYRRLSEPPKVLPDLIQRMVRAGERDEAGKLHATCVSKKPDLRDLCNRALSGSLR